MTRGRPRKKPAEQDQEQQHDDPRDDETNDDPGSLPPSIEMFFDAARASSGAPVRVVLYRVINPRGAGRPKRFFLDEYLNDPPNLIEIGETHGGGEYEIIALAEGDPESGQRKFLKSASFNIDSRFDDIARAKKQQLTPAAAAPAAADPQQAFTQSIAMISGLMQAIAPLIQSRPAENPASMLSAISEIGSGILQNSFKSQLEAQKEMISTLRENMPALSGNSEESDEDKTFDRIMSALETFAPLFLKAPEPIRAPMVAAAKKSPDVKKILNSIEKKQRLRKRLVDKYGEPQAAEIYEIFTNNKRPAQKPVAPAPAAIK